MGGGDKVSIMLVVYPRGTVSVSLLGSFSSVGSSSKSSHPSLPISLLACRVEDYFSKKRGRKQKSIRSQENKSRVEERRKKMRVTVRTRLVFGFGDLIPMESGADNSVEQYTATVNKEHEEPSPKLKRDSWWKGENWPRPKKDLEIWRNTMVNGLCDEACLELGKYPVPRITVPVFCKLLSSSQSYTRIPSL